MTGLNELSADYAALRRGGLKDFCLPILEPAIIDVRSDVFAEPAKASEWFATCTKHIGWARRESWAGLTPPDDGPDFGMPLDGEWVVSETKSIRLVYSGDLWRFITIQEVADLNIARSSDNIIAVLKENVSLVGKLANDASELRYAVYWGAPDPQDLSGMRRLASRFLGFGARGK